VAKKKTSFDMHKVRGAPEGQWCWISRGLVESPAWRARSVHCMRLIEFARAAAKQRGAA
jgi:hypothetical protein